MNNKYLKKSSIRVFLVRIFTAPAVITANMQPQSVSVSLLLRNDLLDVVRFLFTTDANSSTIDDIPGVLAIIQLFYPR